MHHVPDVHAYSGIHESDKEPHREFGEFGKQGYTLLGPIAIRLSRLSGPTSSPQTLPNAFVAARKTVLTLLFRNLSRNKCLSQGCHTIGLLQVVAFFSMPE